MSKRTNSGGPKTPLLLKVPQVADLLQVARNVTYELAATGELPSIRIGRSVRVPQDGLTAWVERSTSRANKTTGE